MKTKRKKKVVGKKRPAKKSIKKRLLKVVLILCLLSIFPAFGFYLYIDHTVKSYLRTGSSDTNSMIYSGTSIIPQKKNIKIPDLKRILALNQYKANQDKNLKPGDYFLDQNEFMIHLRQAKNAHGKILRTEQLSFEVINNAIVKSELNPVQIIIEPQILSAISSSAFKSKQYTKLLNMPKHLVNAVVVVEDERFYSHFGLDIKGIIRAIVTNILKRGIRQGGSTITQQLAKNVLFSHEKTLKRKALEAFAAISFERRLTKDQIVELYLNEIYLGQSGNISIHGFPAAAKFFFNKDLHKINIAEAALLAGLIKAPSYYAPHRHLKRANERRDLVLGKMLEAKMISKQEYWTAKAAKIILHPKKEYQNKSPYFIQALRQNVSEYHNPQALSRNGAKIYTGLDLAIQNCAENAVHNGIKELKQKHSKLKDKPLEVGLVGIETYSGLVKAWVGGSNYRKKQFDHVYQAKRQVGSTIKPFVYLTALDSRLNNYKVANPITILTDEPLAIKQQHSRESWTPKNYDGNFRGAVTLRYALERSLNIPAVYVTQKVSPRNVARTIDMFNIAEDPLAVPSIALGAIESSLLDLTAAYAAIANGGIWIKPRLFISIIDSQGDLILANKIQERKVASETATFVLTNILQGVMERGTARSSRNLGYATKAAGKTGTTNDARDAWFVGYTSDLAAGVWVGLDNNQPIGLAGSQAALPIWTEFMKCTDPSLKESLFIKPKGVVYVDIDSKTGLLYHKGCRGTPVREVFVRGTEPPYYCDHDAKRYKAQRKPQAKPKEKSILELLFG